MTHFVRAEKPGEWRMADGWMDFEGGLGSLIGQMDWIAIGGIQQYDAGCAWLLAEQGRLTNCEMRVSNYDLLISKHTLHTRGERRRERSRKTDKLPGKQIGCAKRGCGWWARMQIRMRMRMRKANWRLMRWTNKTKRNTEQSRAEHRATSLRHTRTTQHTPKSIN